MIVCHCNVLSKRAILAAIGGDPLAMPQSPAHVHRCLGCAPQCGRCLATLRDLLAEARLAAMDAGCARCPGESVCGREEGKGEPDAVLVAVSS